MIIEDVGVRDLAYYSVIDEEWPAVRKNLEPGWAPHGNVTSEHLDEHAR
jgi:hypothetical protein